MALAPWEGDCHFLWTFTKALRFKLLEKVPDDFCAPISCPPITVCDHSPHRGKEMS